MSRVTKIIEPGTPCAVRLKLATVKTVCRRHRLREAEREGRDPMVCHQRATHMVGDIAMCRPHAGQASLAILESEQ